MCVPQELPGKLIMDAHARVYMSRSQSNMQHATHATSSMLAHGRSVWLCLCASGVQHEKRERRCRWLSSSLVAVTGFYCSCYYKRTVHYIIMV